MEVKLDGEAVREMLKASILEQLTPEAQKQLIENAVTHLLRENIHEGRGAPTNLQQIFNDAVRKKAEVLMEAELEKPEVIEAFHGVVREAVAKALMPESEARKDIVDKMASAIRRTITGERY